MLGLASALASAAKPPPLGDWTSKLNAPGISICSNVSACASSTVHISIVSISEFNGTVRSNNTAQNLSSARLDFGDPFAIEYDNDAVAVGRRASLPIPVNSNNSVFQPSIGSSGPVLTVSVLQLKSGRLSAFNDVFDVPVETSAVQVEIAIQDWPFEDWNRSLEVELAVLVPGGAKIPPEYTNATVNVARANSSDRVQYDFPRLSVDMNGDRLEAAIGVYKLADEYRVTLRFLARSLIQYDFLVSPTSPKPPQPTPLAPPTRLNTLPGGFEYCAASNCNNRDGSFSLMLGKLGEKATVVPDNITVSDNVRVNFARSLRDLTFASEESSSIKSLYATFGGYEGQRVTPQACRMNRSMIPTGEIYVGVSLELLAEASNITEVGGAVEIPRDGGTMSVEVVQLDVTDQSTWTFTFFLSAFERGSMISNVKTVLAAGGASTRLTLGGSMYIDFPAFAQFDSYTNPVIVSTMVHSTGEFEGLIEIKLTLSSFAERFAYKFGFSSTAASNGVTNSTPWTPANTTVVPGFERVKTKLLTLSHGEFGLCLKDGSCSDSSVKMGFSGLGTGTSSGGSGVSFGRFAQAQAFEYRDPVLVSEVVKGRNVTKWTTGFRAFIPQSQLRPPIPFDSTLAATSSLPEFTVQVDQYLNAGTSMNGNQEISVPTGALKFSFNLTKWAFGSPSDELVLNITLANATGSGVSGALGFVESKDNATGLSRTVVQVSSTVATVAEFPLFAVIDGVTKPVRISASFDELVGVVVTMRFPSFARSLYYDPVLSSTAQESDDDDRTHTNLRSRHTKSVAKDRVAIVLLAALAFVVVLSVMRCAKRVSIKLDLSKIVP